MYDLDCTHEQKLKGAVSLLRDEAYQWWLAVKEGIQADRLNWEFFKTTFQAKYLGANYVDARKREFLNLTQGEKTVAEYEAEFLQLSRYSRGMMETEYERCARFEDSLRNSLRVLIAPQREQDFTALLIRKKSPRM
ncbi:uncharacterized protein LOC108477462 [Gossypium arboreum]|uniref:uncharacterized protein LOC108477462 n=1 Tax=Gossypium arboreum TaxID=29729 RepID=UPI0008192191|nr:uncharacterized protein LOC108477462 [Gossypium arboreum]